MLEAHPQGRARPTPFMEHPTGQFATSVEAMQDAIQRLRTIPESNKWITFCAQGAGQSENSYHFGEIRMCLDLIELDTPIDINAIANAAQVQTSSIAGGAGTYKLSEVTSLEAARILDAIFRNHLAIRPFADEGGDYAVGAEW